MGKILFSQASLEDGKVGLGIAVVKAISIVLRFNINAFFGCTGANVVDVGAEGAGLDAGMVFAIEFTQGFIAAFH